MIGKITSISKQYGKDVITIRGENGQSYQAEVAVDQFSGYSDVSFSPSPTPGWAFNVVYKNPSLY